MDEVVAIAIFKSGHQQRGWGRIVFDSVDEALEFEQRFNHVLDLRVHIHFMEEVVDGAE